MATKTSNRNVKSKELGSIKSDALKIKGAVSARKVSSTKKVIKITKRKRSKVLYIDACFFFPPNNGVYEDHHQDGRVSVDGQLIAPILLPVGSVMKEVTIYYKNNTSEELTVWIVKHHIDHHAYSGEVEVTYEACLPGTLAPDNFLHKVIDHFDAGGAILDKYMYRIEIGTTMKSGTQERMLRGIRIKYKEPS